MTTLHEAAQRLQKYITRYKKAKSYHPEEIHGFDAGEPSEVILRLPDIEAVLAALSQQGEQQPFGWFKKSELKLAKRFGGSINLWLERHDCDTPLYAGAAPAAQPQCDHMELLKMLATRARNFPSYPMGYHMPEVFAAIGERPPSECYPSYCQNHGRCAHPFCSCGGSDVANA